MKNTPRRIVVLAVLLATGCTDQGPEVGELRQEILANRARWAAVGPNSYTYDVERLCFCPEAARGPVRVWVVSGQVMARTYTATGATVPTDLEHLFPSVDGLFEVLLDALARDAHTIDVHWNTGTGVPVDLWIDYVEGMADEELGYSVRDGPTAGPGA